MDSKFPSLSGWCPCATSSFVIHKTLHTTVHQSQLAGRENPHTLTDTHMHTYNHTCTHTHTPSLTHMHTHTHHMIYISLQRIPHVWTTCIFHTMWSPSSPTRILRRLPRQSCNSIYPQWRLAWMSSLLRSSKYCRRPCTDWLRGCACVCVCVCVCEGGGVNVGRSGGRRGEGGGIAIHL